MSFHRSVFLALLLVLSACSLQSETWYIRPDGGIRGRTGVPGQCDGKSDTAYRGAGTNQHCAFNDFRYLYDDKSYNGISAGWIISGGDTVIIRGCHNPGAKDHATSCRIGGDPPGGPETWCVGGPALFACSAGPIPSGTPSRHTRILGENYATCNAGTATDHSKLTQLFGGNWLGVVLNLQNADYVDLQCLELTDHSDCIQHGSPAVPRPCKPQIDDFATDGLATNNNTKNLLLEDVWIHGFTTTGISGGVGEGIKLNRVNISFNGFTGWNFDDGRNSPNGPHASIEASYVTMIGNGCNEEYPIVDGFPAVSCYDLASQGFGDSWSSQDSPMESFTCDHCVMAYNTKDGFIGPHTTITHLRITNSQSYGNMGQQWKWGAANNSTTIFENNLTVGNCNRMSAPLPGAPVSYNRNLTLFCRADGDIFSFYSAPNSTVMFANNAVAGYSATVFDLSCITKETCASTKFIFRNNIVLGILNPNYRHDDPKLPGLFFLSDPSDKVVADHDIFFNLRTKNCPMGRSDMYCDSPHFINQPPLTLSSESQLDNFNFSLAPSSPAIAHGAPGTGVITDYYNVPRPNPPSVGPIEPRR